MDTLRALLQTLFTDLGFTTSVADGFAFWTLVVALALVAILVGWICNRLITPVILHITSRTETLLDDYFFNRRVLRALWHVVPGLLFSGFLPTLFDAQTTASTQAILTRGAQIYVTLTIILLLTSFLTNVATYATEQGKVRSHYVVGLVSFLKILIWFLGTIVVIAQFLGRNPAGLIAGLGAAATVLMLVFKDTILGLVAGIQLSLNKMLKPGDWITVEKQGINGIVEEVKLTTVKVRNFDNTILTIPPYTLVSEAFQNWEGMKQRAARRVKRAVFIDITSVGFVSQEMLDELQSAGLTEAVAEEKYEENEANKAASITQNSKLITNDTTNLTLFRHYAEHYLRSLPEVVHEETWQWVMARQLDPTPNGLPLEFWFYLGETNFVRYEDLAARCMEHLIATAPRFALRLFQAPTGADIRTLTRPNA